MELQTALARLEEIQRTCHAYTHALSVLNYDGATVAPEKSARGRAETGAVLGGVVYDLLTGSELQGILEFLAARPAELTAEQRRQVELLKESFDQTACIPREEYLAYTRLQTEADAVWHRAKPANDFAAFAPCLEQLIDYNRRFALYYKPDRDPYETMLDQFEKGVTVEGLDGFFSMLRERLVPLIRRIGETAPIDDSLLHVEFPIEKQRLLSDRVMELMTIDRTRCAIGETLHPFTDGFNTDDVRITTNYRLNDFTDSMFSVIHEGGHALYELGVDPAYDGTVLGGGASLGVHESQSRFFENIVGRSRGFCRRLLPLAKELCPALAPMTDEQFYRAINRSHPSLIRTAADELTYPLHIMVRYELEKQLIAGTLPVAGLPAAWNRLYRDYLGVEVPDDEHGCLQDSHWSGGAFGYFPSYALGSAYAAQYLHVMKRDIDFDAAVAGDLSPIVGWLGQHIHRFGRLYDPAALVEKACGAPFDPQYYIDYLTAKYSELYGL